jgi:DNA-binding SARP family transcriptional activator
LYDYLAEEVVGELPGGNQDFLMKTSLLQVVTVPASAALLNTSADQVTALIEQSERLGLISKDGSSSARYRYHPLVREFLTGRLRSVVGDRGIRALHQRAGEWAANVDWRAACFHFEAAGNIRALHDILDHSIDHIAGQGAYELAASYLRRFEPSETTASFEIIASRQEYRAGNFDAAVNRAGLAVALQPDLDVAVSNSITLHGNTGNYREGWRLAKRLAESGSSSLYRTIARASCLMYEASIDGGISDEIDFLRDLAGRTEADELTQFAGVSHLNISLAEQARGEAEACLGHADKAIAALLQTHQAAELASAYLSHAAALATLGDLAGARADIDSAAAVAPTAFRSEWLVEAADIEVEAGSALIAEALLEDARRSVMPNSMSNLAGTVEVRLLLRRGDVLRAQEVASTFVMGEPCDQPGFLSRQMAINAHAAIANQAADGPMLLEAAQRHAERQGAGRWLTYCQMLNALRDPTGGALNTLLRRIPDREYWVCDAFAEEICRLMNSLETPVVERVSTLCGRKPERWLPALRTVVTDPSAPSRRAAAELLDRIGTAEDIPTLRAMARAARDTAGKSLGRALARKLAPRVVIEDLGRVELVADGKAIPSQAVRRKVLAMLSFLLTRTRFAATRDEVIDALWPDLSPDVAANSLNQTVYFLRRVFEPGYVDDLSAGYVHHNSDVLWLDAELISSRSARCLAILDQIRADPSPEHVVRLSLEYTDRFALDFAYEEWAVPFRSALHVAYLEVIESAVTRDMATGHHDRAIEIARRALDLDPTVESLEVALLRLYRATGAHAAAAEQYGHYATVLKEELGVEPPPLASL